MSIARNNVSDEVEGDGDSSGSSAESDVLERVEFLAELYVSVGIAMPVFLLILATVLRIVPDGVLVPFSVLPFVSFVLCSIVVFAQSRAVSDVVAREVYHMYAVVTFLSLFVFLVVLLMLDVSFVSVYPDLFVVSYVRQIYLASVVSVAAPSGYLIGLYVRSGSLGSFVLSCIMSVLFGGLYYGGVFVL